MGGSSFRPLYGLLAAAAFFSSASAAGTVPITAAAAAGVFQYYAYDVAGDGARAGPAAAFWAASEGETYGLTGEARYRRYDPGRYEAGVEVRARYYFHPAPARPYLAPTAGFWLPKDGPRNYKVVGIGARAGGVLTAEGLPFTLDVFAAYRGRFNLDRDERRPSFSSELAAGGTCRWFVTPHFGLRAEGSLLWPAFFGERHDAAGGPAVAPFVLVGPAFAF